MSLIETGIIGLLVFIAALGTGITLANQARRWALTDEERLLAQALLAAVAGVTAAFATFDFFSFQIATGTFFLLLGACGAVWRILRARGARERQGTPGEAPQDHHSAAAASAAFAASCIDRVISLCVAGGRLVGVRNHHMAPPHRPRRRRSAATA